MFARVVVAVVLAGVSAVAFAAPKEYVVVTVKNQSSFANTYEIYDNVANGSLGTITLGPNATTTIRLKSSQVSDVGYASFRSRKSDSDTWNNFELLNDGETRTLN